MFDVLNLKLLLILRSANVVAHKNPTTERERETTKGLLRGGDDQALCGWIDGWGLWLMKQLFFDHIKVLKSPNIWLPFPIFKVAIPFLELFI
jgi:hypothetical protein